MALYNWTDGELVTAEKLNNYGAGMEELKAATEAAKAAAETAETDAQTAETNAKAAQAASETAQKAAETAESNAQTAQKAAETAKTASETAQSKAETARAGSETAQGKAETAQAAAETAKADAAAAQGKAEAAQSAAETANTAAQKAMTAAQSSETNAKAANAEAQQAKTDAQTAKAAAEAAKTSAETANTAAQSAKTAAETAKKAAETAQGKAETANTAAQTAKTAAETAQGKAEAANTGAQTAKTAAEAAQSASQTAQGKAEAAQARAEAAVAHNPTIEEGVWLVWDADKAAYKSTGVPATGKLTVSVTYQQGDTITTPPSGTWQATPPTVEQGKYLWTKNEFSDGTIAYTIARQGMDGKGTVISVNGKSGEVKIGAADVGALPDTTKIPEKTSELTNDSNFAVDANYTHTDNNFTTAEKEKLEGIEAGANKITVDASLGDSTNPVQNKAVNDAITAANDAIATANANITANTTAIGKKVDAVSGKGLSTNDYTTTDKDKLGGIAEGATANSINNYSAALGTTWTDNTGYFTQAVTVAGILENDTPIIDITCSTDNFEAEQEAWGKIFKAVCSADTITFYAAEAVTVALTAQVKVVR